MSLKRMIWQRQDTKITKEAPRSQRACGWLRLLVHFLPSLCPFFFQQIKELSQHAAAFRNCLPHLRQMP